MSVRAWCNAEAAETGSFIEYESLVEIYVRGQACRRHSKNIARHKTVQGVPSPEHDLPVLYVLLVCGDRERMGR